MKRAVLYARYSSVMQTEQSIEGQVHVCEKFAAENDLHIIGQYVDRARSATNDDRPEFQRMIKDSKQGRFDVVLVYKLDRFARNRYDSALYKKKLRDNGIRVVSATENITDSPEGIIMEGLLEAMDEYYSAELSRKVKRGMEESFRKGRFRGRCAPFGYKVVDHKLVIDELTAPIALEIFSRYANGERQNSILHDLNQRQIPNTSGNAWNKTNLSMLLQNRIYAGHYTISSLDGEMPCPAIIDDELFEKVQQMKQESIHRARENKSGYNYFLTGKLMCGECGKAVCGHTHGHGKYHYYRCYACFKKEYRAEELHERVHNALIEYLSSDKINELAHAAFNEYYAEEPCTEREILEAQLKDIEKSIQNALSAILSGFQSESLKSTLGQLESRKSTITDQLISLSPEKPKLTVDYFKYALERIIKTEDYKELLNTVVNRIILKGNQVIICMNLTDNNNEPPLDRILLKVKDTSMYLNQSKIYFVRNWILISA